VAAFGERVKRLNILGTRGVPAAHGGFETFAERLSLFLVQRGWKVTVYCQAQGQAPPREDEWQGVRRVHLAVAGNGAASTVLFDWHATRHAACSSDLCLTLGYNTAVFCLLLRLARVPNVINMDGLEWQRAKWGRWIKIWFRLNEWAGCRLGNHLVADHPEIAMHLSRHVAVDKITTIPYGADRLLGLPEAPVRAMGLEPQRYVTLIARAEPENSVLEMVQGFSRRRRGVVLVVLGAYRDDLPYHCAVRAAASDEVRFLGPLFDQDKVQALRFHSALYFHGHQVGGTNPSLVEALGAGNAIVAHDNRFNRWVAGDAARYFMDADEFARVLDELLVDEAAMASLRAAAVIRHAAAFTWAAVLKDYEALLEDWQPGS
jgi:glycosyltransferase involved in cell wall biosynthesis